MRLVFSAILTACLVDSLSITSYINKHIEGYYLNAPKTHFVVRFSAQIDYKNNDKCEI